MNLIQRMSRLIVAMTLMAGPTGPVYARSAGAAAAPNKGTPFALAQTAKARAGFLNVPLYFEANQGQSDAAVKFFTRAANYNLYLTASEAVMVLPPARAAKARESAVVRMKLKGANAGALARGLDILPARTSYFLGKDPAKWQVGVKQYAKVKYSQVYPGIDMVYYGNQGNVEYDFVVAPGANPGRILVGFEGGKDLRIDPKGNLILRVEGGELTYKAPTLYQMAGARRTHVNGRFVLAGKKQVRFEVGDYIRSKELVIDPQLVYSTYLGGSVDDKITGIAVDATQQAYVTGWSRSAVPGAAGSFPAATATFRDSIPANDGAADVFVAKLSANGATLMWLAWLGGTGDEQANAIALDKSSPSTPKVYITGVTASTAFPVAGPAMQSCNPNTGTLAFIAELTQPANIPDLVYSTCWGGVSGTLSNTGNAIAVDSVGAAYVTGTTFATNFPISAGIPAPFNTMGAASQAGFVVKILPAGTGVSYSMLLGTSDTILNSNAITVDAGFQAWVAGMTTASSLPAVLGHFSSSKVGTSNAFIAQVNTSGTGLLYATYINGNSDQTATAIALNNAGATPYHVFVAGWTVSPTGFPSTAYYNLPTSVRPVVYQKDLVGADDPFILRLNPNEPNPVPGADNPLEMQYATHLGATGADRAFALALDSRDDAYIAGWTLSSNWTLAADPVTPGANGINVTGATTQNTSGGQDAFVAAIGPTGQFQPFFSYLGATPPGQAATGIAIDGAHNIYVSGFTGSAIFPLVTGSLMDSSTPARSINGNGTAGAFDGFVTKIAPVQSFGAPLAAPAAVCTISGINPGSGFAVGGDTVTITGTGFNVAASTVAFDGIASSSFTVNTASTSITVVTPRHPLTGALVTGPVPLTVTTPAGTCSVTYAYVPAAATCSISFINPSSGFTAGGTTVTITGAGFAGFAGPGGVTFDGINASTFTVNASSTIITAVTPVHATVGSVPLTVTTVSSGTCVTTYDYVATPASVCTISGITPNFGFTLGGNVVAITGTGFFGFPAAGGVKFDGINASTYTVNSSSTVITATVPRHPLTGALVVGLVPQTVTTSAGTCSTTYNYLLSPADCGDDYFFPSPATGATGKFAYCMDLPGTARIRIYNVVGDLVAALEDTGPAGAALSVLNTARLAPGVYLYFLAKDYGGGNIIHAAVKKFVVRH